MCCTRAMVSCGNTSLSPLIVFVMKFNNNNCTQVPHKGKAWAAMSTPSKFLITMNSFEITKHCSEQNKLSVQMFPLSCKEALRQDSPQNTLWHVNDWNEKIFEHVKVKFPELTNMF